MNTQYIIYNGKVVKDDQPIFKTNNRAILYGDGFFETILGYYSEIPLLLLHYQRMMKAFQTFGFNNDNFPDLNSLKKIIIHLARKNKIYKTYKIRITIFRKKGGLYLPENDDINYFISISPLQYSRFELNKQGIKIDIYSEFKKNYSPISQFKTLNSLSYIMAARFAQQKFLTDVFIVNNDNYLIETTNSNFFLQSENQIFTPSIKHGCISGIKRHLIINILSEKKIKINETAITPEMLLKADEVFTTNAISGVKFVRTFQKKRYKNTFAKWIIEEINKKVFL